MNRGSSKRINICLPSLHARRRGKVETCKRDSVVGQVYILDNVVGLFTQFSSLRHEGDAGRYNINGGVARRTGLDLTELVNKTRIRSGVIPPKGLKAAQEAR
ncbi:hypothetical protein J6590_069435 [Homalodisca vitripennis]|nr:hypothetical protein J6590_069435 [Homalodisca vitripennis]